MSEETKPAEQNPAQTATPEAVTQPAQWQKPPGYDPVDLDALGIAPEAKQVIEARIRHLYSQAKAGTEAKREARELREHLEKLTPVVEQLAAKDTARTKVQIEDEIVRARDEGRTRDELKLQQELSTLTAPKIEKPEVKTPNEEYVKAAEAWAVETNADGTLKRPWIREDHPDRTKALGVLHETREEWERRGIEISPQTLPLLLSQIDQRMATMTTPKNQTAAVLSTSQVQPPKKADEIELDQSQKFTAERLYSSLPAAKAHEAYANSLKFLRSRGMAR